MNRMPSWPLIWLVKVTPLIIVVVATLLPFEACSSGGSNEVPLSTFVEDVKAGVVDEVRVEGVTLTYVRISDGRTFTARMARGDTIRKVLDNAGVSTSDQRFPNVVIEH